MRKYSKAFLKQLYTIMVKIRICEESLVNPILKREIKCPVHLYSGQEAIATGVCAALTRKDYIFGTHRSHGHYIAKGGGIKELIAEIYGKATGCSCGRGGSMYIISPENGILGTVPIVAGTISLAVGSALASKINKEKRVTVSFFGDGATGEGVLYESLNFAALYKLPILFVCENNFYSTHMSIKECRPRNNISEIGIPFGIKSYRVYGNDVLKVYGAAKKAVKICRENKGPVLIEFITYRIRGHVGADDAIQGNHTDIRPKKEVSAWKKRDPIKIYENYLVGNRIFKKADLDEIQNSVTREIEAGYLFAKKSSYPKRDEIARYVFKK